MSEWARVRLGEVLSQDREYVDIPEAREYKKLSVKLYGKGAVLDPPVRGEALRMQRHQIARSGQVILSEIWGKKGAVGFVPTEGDGALCTSHFFLFDLNQDRLDARWMHYILASNFFEEQLAGEARGTTGYAAVRPTQFLALEIPVPPLREQQRLVTRINELSARLDEATELHRSAHEEAEALLMAAGHATFIELAKAHPPVAFGTLNPHVTSGPRNWGKNYVANGMRFYRAQDLDADGRIVDVPKVYVDPPGGLQGRSAMAREGDLLLVITGATVGRVACFGERHESGFVSQHVAICRLPAEHVSARYAWWGLRLPDGQEQLVGQRYGQGKPGLNLSNIRALCLPVPTLDEQRRIVAELDALETEVNALKVAQAARRAELDALLPAILDRAFAGAL